MRHKNVIKKIWLYSNRRKFDMKFRKHFRKEFVRILVLGIIKKKQSVQKYLHTSFGERLHQFDDFSQLLIC